MIIGHTKNVNIDPYLLVLVKNVGLTGIRLF